jgi:hypothetical protein
MKRDIHSPEYTTNRVSNVAVQKATGKVWPQWFKILDDAGAAKLDHKGIVKILHEKCGVGPWWGQMVTVGYEQARGLRKKGEKADGFEISATKTFGAEAGTLFAAWTDARRRAKWLGKAAFEITTATAGKSIRIKWTEDDTRVSVMFYPKGKGKCAVNVQHGKIKTASGAEKAKIFWAARLGELQKIIEAK